ncbi:MAG TPA: WG repeat-containing protein [Ohtaekwangia sp.]|uniref:WG repeat-containing protein n=1 Tax=Ohtaekwangia sp. TaxID=2066019 RepID=UPI002F95C1BD
MNYRPVIALVLLIISIPLRAQKRFEWIIHPAFEKADPFVNGVAFVTQGDSVHFIDITGKRLHSYLKKEASQFSEDMCLIVVNGKHGFLDRSGNMVVKPQYDYATNFAEGIAIVLTKDKMGAIDKKGNMVIPAIYFGLLAPAEGLVPASKYPEKKWGFMDTKGKTVIPFVYDNVKNAPGVNPFKNGLATVTLQGKMGYIDKTGKMVIANKFDQADDFEGDLAKASYKGKWGFIDKTGKFVIPAIYESYPAGFSEGLAHVNTGPWDHPQFGYFDTTGKMIIPARYTWADSFHDGVAMVKQGDQTLYINKAGEVVSAPAVTPKHDAAFPALEEVGELSDGLRAARKNGLWGYMKPRIN